ncbi:glycosyltransferase [Avibacterium paragallinarum]|uniref:glycosyltransferase n=1 Tax=Avibacterium paragallinarum TaxID=728 RepID=UPI0010AA2EF8
MYGENDTKTINQTSLTLDVIIPCYNAQKTLIRAVKSVLQHQCVQYVWLIDDGSIDNTWDQMQRLAQSDKRIRIEKMPYNSGVAKARNWGALQSEADLIAFLDADDAYQAGALENAPFIFSQLTQLGGICLPLYPVDFPQQYLDHPGFSEAWYRLCLIVASNKVFRRRLFLACGGYPQDSLYQQFGGEDAALMSIMIAYCQIGTLFEDNLPGALHYYHSGMHAERLLMCQFQEKIDEKIAPHLQQALQINAKVRSDLKQFFSLLTQSPKGICPLILTFQEDN